MNNKHRNLKNKISIISINIVKNSRLEKDLYDCESILRDLVSWDQPYRLMRRGIFFASVVFGNFFIKALLQVHHIVFWYIIDILAKTSSFSPGPRHEVESLESLGEPYKRY